MSSTLPHMTYSLMNSHVFHCLGCINKLFPDAVHHICSLFHLTWGLTWSAVSKWKYQVQFFFHRGSCRARLRFAFWGGAPKWNCVARPLSLGSSNQVFEQWVRGRKNIEECKYRHILKYSARERVHSRRMSSSLLSSPFLLWNAFVR